MVSKAAWYHMQSSELEVAGVLCLCPEAKNEANTCFHSQFILGEASKAFFTRSPLQGKHLSHHLQRRCISFQEVEENRTFLFYRYEEVSEGSYQNLFSVPSQTRFPNLKNRAVVEHRGVDSGSGSWKCSKDSGAISCPHIIAARHSLQQHLKGDWNARDESVRDSEESTIAFGGKQWYLPNMVCLN